MIKGEGLAVLEEKMDALDPNKNEIYKFLGCEQANKIYVKRVMERVKKEIRRRLDHLMGLLLLLLLSSSSLLLLLLLLLLVW